MKSGIQYTNAMRIANPTFNRSTEPLLIWMFSGVCCAFYTAPTTWDEVYPTITRFC